MKKMKNLKYCLCLGCLIGLGVLLGSRTWADPIGPEGARDVVRGWLKHGAHPLGTALGKDIEQVLSYPDDFGQAAWYVVGLRPAGFVIVAADDWLEPIVAFAPKGRFDPSPKHPLGALVGTDLPGRLAQIRIMRRMLAGAPPPAGYRANQDQWNYFRAVAGSKQGINSFLPSVSDERVPPLIASLWDQESEGGAYDYCYNYFTPNHDPCGCVATAAAQLMRYHQYPVAGVGAKSFWVTVENDPNPYQRLTLLGGDGAGGPYNWSMMPLDPEAATPENQRQAIGALCHDFGAAVESRYGPLSTSADFFTIGNALKSVFYFNNAIASFNNYDSIESSALSGMLNPNLDAGLPTLLALDGDSGGHAIVCDGYGYDHGAIYHHLNLGWGAYFAADNAWYALPAIDPPEAEFSVVVSCLYNVYPSGSGEIVSGRITDSIGRPLAEAAVIAEQDGAGSLAVYSDSRGIYALSRLPSSADYTLRVEKAGYTFSARAVATGASVDYANVSGNRWGIDFVGAGGVGPDPDPSNQPAVADYDGDGKADPGIYQTAAGCWYVWLSSLNYSLSGPHALNQSGYTLSIPADYDGDRKFDPAVFNAATGAWYVWLSAMNYAGVAAAFARSGFTSPVPADYDGDGKADPAVFNPASGEWYFWLSSSDYSASGPRAFSYPGYTVPVPADYDGDGKADPAVFTPSLGKWYIWLSTAAYAGAGPYAFGQAGFSSPVPADYDGDRRADPGVFNPATGNWYVWLSASDYAPVGPVHF